VSREARREAFSRRSSSWVLFGEAGGEEPEELVKVEEAEEVWRGRGEGDE
jgi:hypothetical protein